MADFDRITWVDEVTKVGPTNMNRLEAGVKDAAEHQNAGTFAARPPADAAHKHHIWVADDGRSYYCDGAAWLPLARRFDAPSNNNALALSNPTATGHALTNNSTAAQKMSLTGSGVPTRFTIPLWRDAGVTAGTVQIVLLGDLEGSPSWGNVIAQSETIGVEFLPLVSVGALGVVFDLTPPLPGAQFAGAAPWVGIVVSGVTGGSIRTFRGGSGSNHKMSPGPGNPWTAGAYPLSGANILVAPPGSEHRAATFQSALRGYDSGGIPGVRIGEDGSLYGPRGMLVSGYDGASDLTRVLRGLASERPAAALRTREMVWISRDTGEVSYCDGSAWLSFTGYEPWREVGAAGNPGFTAPWVNLGGGSRTAAFRKSGDGTVQIKGTVQSGFIGSEVYILPVGYRPAQDIRATAAIFTGSTHYHGMLYITVGGSVQLHGSGIAGAVAQAGIEFTFQP